ncbi:zf-HC2 domain-containing protein [Paenibacillus sp. J2TS4]|uniref:zf-HC2 domain-containing protein n=1 Tax=Paenibacillus sp. J2TS4 TaxID=2807194 RepID=UPI001B2D299A|nr:zf-HC2 domain-containing protein [Paenibacillus sp. J2TS4]GIP35869.1 hypothetical protein J2TS4_50790 [Paenibacillus sp. J2TS4]
MNCHEAEELLQRYLDSDLAKEEEKRFFLHIEQCADCADQLQRMKRLSEELDSLSDVVPPISIVDSILPKLMELDSAAGMNSKEEHPAVTSPISSASIERSESPRHSRPRRGRWMWTAISGVAAAGVALGIFIFDSPNSNVEYAELSLSREIQDMSSKEAPSSGAETNNEAQHNGESGALEDTPEGNESADSLGDSALDKRKKTDSDKVPAEGLDARISSGSTSRSGDSKADSTSPDTSETHNVSKSIADGMPSAHQGDTPPSANSPSAPAEPGIADEPEPESAVVDAEQGLANEAGPSFMGIPPAEEGADRLNFKSGPDDTAGSASFTSEDEGMESPDGSARAFIIDQKLYVNDEEGRLLYASLRQWKPEDTVLLVEWLNDRQLVYEVQSDSGTSRYTVDVVEQTELKN